jgi:hypothetical protein
MPVYTIKILLVNLKPQSHLKILSQKRDIYHVTQDLPITLTSPLRLALNPCLFLAQHV